MTSGAAICTITLLSSRLYVKNPHLEEKLILNSKEEPAVVSRLPRRFKSILAFVLDALVFLTDNVPLETSDASVPCNYLITVQGSEFQASKPDV